MNSLSTATRRWCLAGFLLLVGVAVVWSIWVPRTPEDYVSSGEFWIKFYKPDLETCRRVADYHRKGIANHPDGLDYVVSLLADHPCTAAQRGAWYIPFVLKMRGDEGHAALVAKIQSLEVSEENGPSLLALMNAAAYAFDDWSFLPLWIEICQWRHDDHCFFTLYVNKVSIIQTRFGDDRPLPDFSGAGGLISEEVEAWAKRVAEDYSKGRLPRRPSIDSTLDN